MARIEAVTTTGARLKLLAWPAGRSPQPVLYSNVSMPEDSTRNWTRTYVSVIVIEVLALMGLWWLQSHYGT